MSEPLDTQNDDVIILNGIRFLDSNGNEVQENSVVFLLRVLIAEVHALRMGNQDDDLNLDF